MAWILTRGLELVSCEELTALAHCLPFLGIVILGTLVATWDMYTSEVGAKSLHLGTQGHPVYHYLIHMPHFLLPHN